MYFLPSDSNVKKVILTRDAVDATEAALSNTVRKPLSAEINGVVADLRWRRQPEKIPIEPDPVNTGGGNDDA